MPHPPHTIIRVRVSPKGAADADFFLLPARDAGMVTILLRFGKSPLAGALRIPCTCQP